MEIYTGSEIKKERKRYGFSLQGLALVLRVHPKTLSFVERGKSKSFELRYLATLVLRQAAKGYNLERLSDYTPQAIKSMGEEDE